MIPTITFQDLTDKDLFLKTINRFAILDDKQNPYEVPYSKVFKGDFSIIYKVVNPVTYDDTYEERFFYADYLTPGIEKLSTRYMAFFKKELNHPYFLEKKNIKLKAEDQMEKLIKLQNNLAFDYLEDSLTEKISIQIDIIIEYLKEVYLIPNSTTVDKLQFKLNKDTFLVLMTILREKGIVDCPYDSNLGRLIDSSFTVWDNKTQEYKTIAGSGKVINDIKNGNKSINRSIERLKNIFREDTFFNL